MTETNWYVPTTDEIKASGWVKEADVVDRQWTHTDGKPRRTDQPNDNKTRWAKQLTPARPTV